MGEGQKLAVPCITVKDLGGCEIEGERKSRSKSAVRFGRLNLERHSCCKLEAVFGRLKHRWCERGKETTLSKRLGLVG
jgi:hypothetical protein